MKYRKGYKLVFKDRVEVITTCSNNPITGMITTNEREYSTDFINRWISFGFVKLEK